MEVWWSPRFKQWFLWLVSVRGSVRQICKIPVSRDLSHVRTAMSLDLQGQLNYVQGCLVMNEYYSVLLGYWSVLGSVRVRTCLCLSRISISRDLEEARPGWLPALFLGWAGSPWETQRSACHRGVCALSQKNFGEETWKTLFLTTDLITQLSSMWNFYIITLMKLLPVIYFLESLQV